MNSAIMIGRLTDDPKIRYTQEGTAIANYRLAVDRMGEGADFIPCTAFGKGAEFAQKYLHKGMKIAVTGSIRTGSYTNKDGKKVYTWNVTVGTHDFCESKKAAAPAIPENDDFMTVPEGIAEELPFN